MYYASSKSEDALATLFTSKRLNLAAANKVLIKERQIQRELDPGKKHPMKNKKNKKRKRQGIGMSYTPEAILCTLFESRG